VIFLRNVLKHLPLRLLPPRQERRFPRLPIAILSFNRPDYLRRVLQSLRRQIQRGDEIVLFQDGAFNPASRQWKSDPARIGECIAVFRAIIPWGEIRQSPDNLGSAHNYRRAEAYAFVERDHDACLFLEDDLVLSRHYLAAIHTLIGWAHNDPRIAYVSAYGDLWAGLYDQWRNRRGLMHMHENWGFAMTRAAWLDEQPFRRSYFALIEGTDYTQRDHQQIRSFFHDRGIETPITGQDFPRWFVTMQLGKVRISTTACYARYIGREGQHATAEYYDRLGFGQTRMAPWPPNGLAPPTDVEMARWLEIERERFSGVFKPFYQGHASTAPHALRPVSTPVASSRAGSLASFRSSNPQKLS
jgi:hypothetical protein